MAAQNHPGFPVGKLLQTYEWFIWMVASMLSLPQDGDGRESGATQRHPLVVSGT